MKRKTILFTVITLLLLLGGAGCEREKEKGQLGTVFVSVVEMPSQVKVGRLVPIHVVAYANNGCWSNLKINLTKCQESYYQITAMGFYSGDLTCPDILIGTDTTFHLIFHEAGECYFQSNRSPFPIKYDTIMVSE
ncbi:hypothetical protein SDC9_130658 [bioreactor metagenome]|jgi:hypothetical protein|uniref:Lipoprotein n=1 Tax=bioreactor metagenome TaxID=1076179 RepID=A0A645D4M2_9ZZZZ|nr:hypothetical protein [Paludibacter sp.]